MTASSGPLIAEIVAADLLQDASRPRRGWFGAILATIQWLFGLVSMIVLLAVAATIPVLQLLSLGYLLEVSGRVARTGRLRDGFIGIRNAARVGSLLLGTGLFLLPILFVREMWLTAQLIDPSSDVTRGWRIGLVVVSVLLLSHILWAWLRGGRFRHFAWPAPLKCWRQIRDGGLFTDARDATLHFVSGLRLPHYFWLGLRGFVAALVWLVIPVTLLAVATRLPEPAAVLVGLLGGLLLATVLLYLPLLQAHFAAEDRFGAMFEVRAVRRLYRRAPIACWFALLITLSFALPLYLLKIELLPREAAWLPSLVFVVFIFPARLLTGWAMGRARHHPDPRNIIFRWLARLAAIPVVIIYSLIVYLTQYLSWYGAYSLYEQHAFLVPVPFLGL
ncbi:MAG TPA: DUF4013 domain-containing protein [Pirellulales bacterium]|nr:DUF4013 domain-containing protein [Pirellulales bacterium]